MESETKTESGSFTRYKRVAACLAVLDLCQLCLTCQYMHKFSVAYTYWKETNSLLECNASNSTDAGGFLGKPYPHPDGRGFEELCWAFVTIAEQIVLLVLILFVLLISIIKNASFWEWHRTMSVCGVFWIVLLAISVVLIRPFPVCDSQYFVHTLVLGSCIVLMLKETFECKCRQNEQDAEILPVRE